MADSRFVSSSITRRVRWFAIPAALFTAGGAILLWRRGQSEAALPSRADVAGEAQIQSASVAVQAQPRKPQSPVRWLLYVGAAMLCAGLLVILQTTSPELSAAVFMLLLLASALYGVFRSADGIGRFILRSRHAISYPRAVLQYNAPGLSLAAGSISISLAFGSAVLFWDSRSYWDLTHEAGKLFILSLLTLWAALALRPTDLPVTTIVVGYPLADPELAGFRPSLQLFIRRAWRRLALFGGLALMVIVTEINGQFIKSDILAAASLNFQFVLLIAAAGLLVIGLTGVTVHESATTKQSWLERWQPLWPIALITLLAFALRFWHLDTAMRFLVDERSFIDGTYSAAQSPFNGLLQPFSSISAFPFVFPYWQSLMMKLFGMGLFGFRATSAIIGALTIPGLYFLARTLFDRKTALLAALFLATFPPHLQFSRIGMNNIADPLIGTWAFAFLMSGLKLGKRSHFAMAGVLFGFTQYFYEGGRLMLVPLGLLTLVVCVFFAQLPDAPFGVSPWGAVLIRFRRLTPKLLILVVALVVFAAPIYLTLVGMQRPILARFVDNGLGLGPDYWKMTLASSTGFRDHIIDHILPAFEMYFNHIDTTFYYSKTTSLLLSGVLPFAIIGFAFLCYYWRKPGSILLSLWIICTALGNSLMKDSTSSSRFVIVFPALALLVAVGLRYVVPMVVRRPRWQLPIIATVGILLAIYQTNFYFNLHLPEYNYIFREASPGPDGYDAAWRSVNFPQNTQVHIISTPIYNQIEAEGLIRVWRADILVDTILSRRVLPRYLKELTCGVDHAFYVQKKDEDVIALLNRYFKLEPPQFTPFTDVDPSERMVLYYAPNNPNDGSLFSYYCKRKQQSS